MKLINYLVVVFSVLSLAVSVVNAKTESQKLHDFDSKLAKSLVQDKGALLLDVRTETEFNQVHLPNAKRIDIAELEGKLDQVKEWTKGDMERPIVVYCRSGGRAGKAKTILQNAGFKNVMNLGGYSNWEK